MKWFSWCVILVDKDILGLSSWVWATCCLTCSSLIECCPHLEVNIHRLLEEAELNWMKKPLNIIHEKCQYPYSSCQENGPSWIRIWKYLSDRSAATAFSGNWLVKQILRPYPRPHESETPGVGFNRPYSQALEVILMHAQIWEPLL